MSWWETSGTYIHIYTSRIIIIITIVIQCTHTTSNIYVQVPRDKEQLRCFHAYAKSDWLRLGPMKIQVNSYDPYHAVIKQLIFNHECDRIQKPLVRLLEARSVEKYGIPADSTEWIDIRVMKK